MLTENEIGFQTVDYTTNGINPVVNMGEFEVPLIILITRIGCAELKERLDCT